MPEPHTPGGLIRALPFWMSLTLLAVIGIGAWFGGWALALIPIYGFGVMTLLDAIGGLNPDNPDPNTPDNLFWYKLITWIWLPLQLTAVYGCLWLVTNTDHLSSREGLYLMLGLGVISGAIGIVYAHELMHQKDKTERLFGEWLMISVLYGHFVTEHLAVHHRLVATPKDAATARYNESFYAFFPRVLYGSLRSAWRVEADRQRARNQPVWHRSNPFWRYWGGALLFLSLAYLIGGWAGVGLYIGQAFIAVLQLEQINYIEHYGLLRRRLANGKYETVAPRHSWNAAHRFTNYLLINLQRHSDHHIKPDRRFPLLQNYRETEAPQLPFGYPMMVLLLHNPWLWRKVMNPRVRRWRSMYYPDILHWSDPPNSLPAHT